MREARALCEALGGTGFAEASRALLARGEKGAEALLRALARGVPLGPAGANGRAVMEDLEGHLVSVARSHPAVLLRAAARHTPLLGSLAFVSALSCIPGDEADEVLLGLLGARDGSIRWLALEALVERREPRALARLGEAARDRDGLVVFAAVCALRRWGGDRDLPRLVQIGKGKRTPIGTREAVYDAIESICARTGAALPPGTPAPRLLTVPLPSRAQPSVTRAELVKEGAELARAGTKRVRAPCDGVVVALDLDEGVVLRRS